MRAKADIEPRIFTAETDSGSSTIWEFVMTSAFLGSNYGY